MMNRKVLLICIPLLTVMACKGKSKKHNTPAPVPPVAGGNSNVDNGGVVPPGSGTVPVPGTDTNQSSPPAGGEGTAAIECETIMLDFDTKPDGSAFRTGEKIKDQYKDYGITLISHKRLASGEMENNVAPILFDTAARPDENTLAEFKRIDCENGNCDGFDQDLTTQGEGKALIIAEHMYDIVPSDDKDFVTYPDDNTYGGVIKLFFAKPTSLVSIDFIDIEKESNLELYTRKADGEYVKTTAQNIPIKGDGELQTLSVDDHSYTDKLMINLSNSGAVDNIKICIKK